MTGGSAPITQNTANTLLGTCWEHRVSASCVFLLACILRSNFFLHSTLLLILGIRLNSSIDITAKRVLMLSKRALRSLRPHPPSAMCCKQNSVTSAAYFVSRPPSYTLPPGATPRLKYPEYLQDVWTRLTRLIFCCALYVWKGTLDLILQTSSEFMCERPTSHCDSSSIAALETGKKTK